VAALGPTNTGKTHLAVERMLGHSSGMIGLPLRLLAREIYDRVAKARGPRSVALITGEEKIVPPRAQYFVCTVEAMPLSREVEFLAVDEIQLAADAERGHVFTHRLLHARGGAETMLLGAATMAPLVRRLLPHAEIATRDRFSKLAYSGPKKLTRLPRRSAVVAFSADQVYAIAELIRRQRGGAAVVMGSLSPRTRNAQVALYQSGEVDFLVATDAIGMGLNMDVDHVAFAGLSKFDGRRNRPLTPQEIGQIAGRAGRYQRDGTFGVTGEAEDMDPDVVQAVEEHRFQPVGAAEWRNPKIDLSSLANLMRSLARPPDREGLRLAAEALDETTLRKLAEDPQVADRVRDRSALIKLWDVCQTPDFRKLSLEEHVRLTRDFFGPHPRGLDRAAVRPSRPHRGRDRRPRRPPRQRPHPGLCGQPARLAGRPYGLAGADPDLGGPALRHLAREADGPFRGPPHERADAGAQGARGPAGRRRRRRDGDRRGPLCGPARRRQLRGGARVQRAGAEGAQGGRPPGPGAGDR
jgi:ATP-dependent RNA helicase SUPV3L1/SUV3